MDAHEIPDIILVKRRRTIIREFFRALHIALFQAFTAALAFVTAKAVLSEVDWSVVGSAAFVAFLMAIKPYFDPNKSEDK